MPDYEAIRVTGPVKELLDDDQREDETRDEQIRRLLGADVPPKMLEIHEATEQKLEQLREELNRVPDRTAEEIEGRLR